MIVAKTPLLQCAALRGDAERCASRLDRRRIAELDQRPVAIEREGQRRGRRPLLAAESISIDRAPLNLAMNSRDLGMIQIIRPAIHLKVRPDGSNLEDALAKTADRSVGRRQAASWKRSTQPARRWHSPFNSSKERSSPKTSPPAAQWRIDGVNAAIRQPRRSGGLGSGSLAGADRGRRTERRRAACRPGDSRLTLKPAIGGRQELTLQAEGVALAVAEPWLRRFAPAAN